MQSAGFLKTYLNIRTKGTKDETKTAKRKKSASKKLEDTSRRRFIKSVYFRKSSVKS